MWPTTWHLFGKEGYLVTVVTLLAGSLALAAHLSIENGCGPVINMARSFALTGAMQISDSPLIVTTIKI